MLLVIKEIRLLHKHRELLWQITAREIKARYKQSFLGYFWVIFNPLAQMLVMSFAFSIVLRVPTYASIHIPYSIFLFVGLLPWNLFASSIASASGSLVANASLITKIYFPRSILPLATVAAKIVDFTIALIVLVSFLIWYQIPITIHILWVIPIFFIQQIFTIGLSLFFASTNLLYRDIQHILNLLLLIWLYITPVFYSTDMVPPQFKFIYQLNPISVIINAYRQTVLAGGMPSLNSLWIASIVSLLVLYLGLLFFKKQEKYFADIV